MKSGILIGDTCCLPPLWPQTDKHQNILRKISHRNRESSLKFALSAKGT